MAGLPPSRRTDWPRARLTGAWGPSDISTARTSAESPPTRCWGRSAGRGAAAVAGGDWGRTFWRALFLDLRAIARLSLPMPAAPHPPLPPCRGEEEQAGDWRVCSWAWAATV